MSILLATLAACAGAKICSLILSKSQGDSYPSNTFQTVLPLAISDGCHDYGGNPVFSTEFLVSKISVEFSLPSESVRSCLSRCEEYFGINRLEHMDLATLTSMYGDLGLRSYGGFLVWFAICLTFVSRRAHASDRLTPMLESWYIPPNIIAESGSVFRGVLSEMEQRPPIKDLLSVLGIMHAPPEPENSFDLMILVPKQIAPRSPIPDLPSPCSSVDSDQLLEDSFSDGGFETPLPSLQTLNDSQNGEEDIEESFETPAPPRGSPLEVEYEKVNLSAAIRTFVSRLRRRAGLYDPLAISVREKMRIISQPYAKGGSVNPTGHLGMGGIGRLADMDSREAPLPLTAGGWTSVLNAGKRKLEGGEPEPSSKRPRRG